MIRKLLIVFLFFACKHEMPIGELSIKSINQLEEIKSDSLLMDRFSPPEGFNRQAVDSQSFAFFLRHLKLKPTGAKVKLYNGELKPNQNAHEAVIDFDVGTRDLQQCADAVMRIRGEYLYEQNKFEDIAFDFISDGKPRYFLQHSEGKTDYYSFRKYLNYVYSFSNTRSLYHQMNIVSDFEQLQQGDAFVQTGRPYGHAVIVVDVAVNDNGEKVFMVAQSYMPAQSIHILKNPNNSVLSPWYKLDINSDEIITPEWVFHQDDLRRF